MRSLWDISPSVSTRAPVFPGDTPFQVLWNERINDGGVANISTIHMSPHVGAHVDAPMHLDSGAVDVATLRLERFIGRCRVIDLSQVEAGDYELIALPLKLEGVEASPVRAVLRSVAHR